MKLTNKQIYNYANELASFKAEGKMPVKINFFLQKNIQTIIVAAREIEQARMDVAKQFGEPNEANTGYIIPPENMAAANQELNDLLALEQDLNIHVFKLEEFDNIELTFQQLSAIMFMIEE